MNSRPFAIRLSARARTDLLDIWLYVSARNPAAADRALDDIERICELLRQHPQMGRERPEILLGLRSFAVNPWIVFYRLEANMVDVVRIVHGARDVDQLDFL